MPLLIRQLLTTLSLIFCLCFSHLAFSETQPAASQDPIIVFANASFADKEKMLKAWPFSAEDKQKVMQLVLDEMLYTDDKHQVYLLKNGTELYTYPQNTAVGDDWPSSLDEVALNSRLKQALEIGNTLDLLKDPDPKNITKAVTTLEAHPNMVDAATLKSLIEKAPNADIKAQLESVLAAKDLQSSDAQTQIAAAKTLSASHDPQTITLINQATKDGLPEDVRKAFTAAKASISTHITHDQWIGHIFSGLSQSSILLLAALGLAITFGLVGVINMAHGEMIMLGAYATYLTQSFFHHYLPTLFGWYLPVSILTAFLLSAIVGIIIERLIIRPLYGRQLETLLATFGVSLVLIQLVRLIFGPQNVAMTTPAWLSGAVNISPVLTLPYNRIAVIVLTIAVIIGVKLLISYTRLGLFIRAVTQNRQMARAVGVRSARVDMFAFGLGSGLAGIAGCALTQIGNVGPEMGQSLIVDSFLVVVVGGVGQLIGAVIAALALGIGGTLLDVSIGAVLSKITVLVLIIIFIQKRPQGLFAVKGRFVE